jgi:hypothetical protein
MWLREIFCPLIRPEGMYETDGSNRRKLGDETSYRLLVQSCVRHGALSISLSPQTHGLHPLTRTRVVALVLLQVHVDQEYQRSIQPADESPAATGSVVAVRAGSSCICPSSMCTA